jgi:hypothetical protein
VTETLASKEELTTSASIDYAGLGMAPCSPFVVPSVAPVMPTLEAGTCEFVFLSSIFVSFGVLLTFVVLLSVSYLR